MKASSTPRLPNRNVSPQAGLWCLNRSSSSCQGTPRWMAAPQARAEELEREKRRLGPTRTGFRQGLGVCRGARDERLKKLEQDTREARQRLQMRLQALEQKEEGSLKVGKVGCRCRSSLWCESSGL